MIFFFIDSSLILFILLLALSVFYTAGTFLNGIISTIAMVLFTIEVIAGIIILFVKFHKIKVKDNT